MKEISIVYKNSSFTLELGDNEIIIRRVCGRQAWIHNQYKFSRVYNCPICSNSNTSAGVVCGLCKGIERIDSREYEKIVTFGDYYSYIFF
ncbi:MAG: hypothetical protein ACFFC6_01150 [Promethearchaeota archaeon]